MHDLQFQEQRSSSLSADGRAREAVNCLHRYHETDGLCWFSGPIGAEQRARERTFQARATAAPTRTPPRLCSLYSVHTWWPGRLGLGPEETRNVQHEYTTPPVMHQSPTAQITVRNRRSFRLVDLLISGLVRHGSLLMQSRLCSCCGLIWLRPLPFSPSFGCFPSPIAVSVRISLRVELSQADAVAVRA